MIETYSTSKGWPLHLSSIDEIDFNKIAAEFNLKKKTVRTVYTLPRMAFIGNFNTLSLTCQRKIAQTLNFEYMEKIKLGTFDPGEMQILTSKWPDITTFTKLIILGDPCIKSKKDGSIKLDWEAERYLFKTYKNEKFPLYLQFKIPVVTESELVKLHSKYPNINNNTQWKNEPLLNKPLP